MPVPVGVLGAGSFGTCLAILCAREHDVTLWARDPATAEAINREHRNPRYLREVPIPERVRATADVAEALAERELVICAVPSHGVREVMARASPHLAHGSIVCSTVKGIEVDTCLRMDQVLEQVIDPDHHVRLSFLSGPSFAKEVARHAPTAVTIACREENYAIAVQESISCPWFRGYTTSDVVGVQIGGAVKNVIAIAVGVCDGLELGLNARAGVMTRGLHEITKLGEAMGADPLTFLGLAGMGDLILTCTGDLSRNRRVGLGLGQGRALDEIVAELGEVAEGIPTTRAACRLARRLGVEMPICEAVRAVLEDGADIPGALAALLGRPLRAEPKALDLELPHPASDDIEASIEALTQ